MNNVAVYITPQPDHPEHGAIFLGAITAVEDASGTASLAELLPPDWEGKYTPHFYEITDNFDIETNVVWGGGFFRSNGITHVALLEGPKTKRIKGSYFFGPTKIDENSVICWYRQDGQFQFFHCNRCAVMVLQWIVNEQEKWDADCTARPQTSKARN